MIDYSKSKIYTIRNQNDTSLIYVGSTTQPLSKRWGEHKKKSRECPLRLIYKTINSEWEEWYIELYQLCPCNSREELQQKEGEIIRLIGTLNLQIAGRTKPEYRIDNADKIKENKKQYRIDNADKIKESKKQYRIENADKIRESKKQYQIENADKIKKYNVKYYQEKKKQEAWQEIQKYTYIPLAVTSPHSHVPTGHVTLSPEFMLYI